MAVLYKGEIMLSSKVINYLKQKNAWFENVDIDCERYREILKELNLDTSSDFGIFYTHAEENPGGFYSKKFELWQICWMYENSDYRVINNSLRRDLSLNDNYYVISEFEGERAYFYNKEENSVEIIGYSENGVDVIEKWESFNDFLEWYFEI